MPLHCNFLIWLPKNGASCSQIQKTPAPDTRSRQPVRSANPKDHWLCRPPASRVLERDGKTLFIQGYARSKSSESLSINALQLLRTWMDAYLEQGEFRPSGLDGAYSAVLVDPKESLTFVYRGLIGHTAIYYHQRSEGLLVGSNLAEFVSAIPEIGSE